MDNPKKYFKRFSVTMPADLYEEFGELIELRGKGNRSKSIADLVKDEVIRLRQEEPTQIMAGTITLNYSEAHNSCANRLIKLRRNTMEEIISCQQIMFEDGKLMEIWLVQGQVQVLREIFANALQCSSEMSGSLNFTDSLMPPVVLNNKYTPKNQEE